MGVTLPFLHAWRSHRRHKVREQGKLWRKMTDRMITLADLAGQWMLTRRIIDHLGGRGGRFVGQCHWWPETDGLRQDESGLLHYAYAPPMQAHRRYLWRAEGEGLIVFFDDGRPFHRLGPGHLSDRHFCDPDIYDVRYDFSQWPLWTQSWLVQGPRKNMSILSRFQRGG